MRSPRAFFALLSAAVLTATWAFSQAQTAPAPPPQKSPAAPETKPAPKPVKPTDVVLWIGNEAITAERFEELSRAVPQGTLNAMGKKQFASQYGMLRGLAMEAEKQKLDQTSAFQQHLALTRLQLLAQAEFNELTQETQVISDAEIQKHYKEHEGDFRQAKVRGIFVSLTPPSKAEPKPGEKPEETKKADPKTRTDAEAKEMALKLRQKILAGADFAAVAKESSDDAATAAKGGDFGTVRKGQLPPNMEKVVFALKPKEVSEPVQEARGYYLFTVDEVRNTTFEEATPLIRNQLQQQKFTAALEKVKAQYPVKFNDDYFDQQPGPAGQPRITGVAPAQPAPSGAAPQGQPASGKPAPPKK